MAISNFPDWSKLRTIARKERGWQIPVLAIEGGQEQAIPAIAAFACAQISILLIDDLLDADSDLRGEYHLPGAPAIASLAVALQTVSLEMEMLAKGGTSLPDCLVLLPSMDPVMLPISGDQQRDTQNPNDETAYWRVVEMKSAPFFGTAVYKGAILGGASAEMAEWPKGWGVARTFQTRIACGPPLVEQRDRGNLNPPVQRSKVTLREAKGLALKKQSMFFRYDDNYNRIDTIHGVGRPMSGINLIDLGRFHHSDHQSYRTKSRPGKPQLHVRWISASQTAAQQKKCAQLACDHWGDCRRGLKRATMGVSRPI